MAPPLLLLQDIRLTLGTAVLLDGAELSVGAGDRVCLVGRNGSGKSSLLKIAAGLLTPDGGTTFLQPGTTIRYLPQEPDLSGSTTALAYVEEGLGPSDDPHRARSLLNELGLTGMEAPAQLSGGEARRCALARALAPSPDILLLDEPTNHLDLPAIEWLQNELAGLRCGIIIISHDRRLMEAVSRSIVWLDGGITRRVERPLAQFESWRDEVLEQEARTNHKLGRKIAMEENWLRYGVTARRKRNARRLGALQDLRAQRRDQRQALGKVNLAASDAGLSGKQVIAAHHASVTLSGRILVKNFSIRVLRGDRIGIVGRNGAGKTTLLRMLTGMLSPDAGEVRLGTSLLAVTLDQERESLDPTQTLLHTLTGGAETLTVGEEKRHVVGYMKDFLFLPEQAGTPVGMLSGGERARLMLASALAKPSNLLVLDEPTNDLDLETLELLQEMLADYPGTVILVSHDRDFLDKVVTSVVFGAGDGTWVEYAGGYSDMLAQRRPTIEPSASLRTVRSKGELKVNAPRRGLSFKEQHTLQSLPKRIAALEEEERRLAAILSDVNLYGHDAASLAGTSERLTKLQAELGVAEDLWLELELKNAEK